MSSWRCGRRGCRNWCSPPSAIYGELDRPLNEETGQLWPISLYGAAKLGSDAFISAFSACFGIQAYIFRPQRRRIVREEMGLPGAAIRYTGGDRARVGGRSHFRYDLSKIYALG